MQPESSQVLDKILQSETDLDEAQILDYLLPPTGAHYSWNDIDKALEAFNIEVERVQRDNNDQFDQVLDENVQQKLKSLCSDLKKTQSDVMSLHHNISHAKEQFMKVRTICKGDLVKGRTELLENEKDLRQSLQRHKFANVILFFDKFLEHLDLSVESCRKLLAYNSSEYKQSFDWTYYHQAMFLLRACGKTMIDIDKFERLYLSKLEYLRGLVLKQSLDQIDLNNFIQFQTTYSLESQFDVLVDQTFENQSTQRMDFGLFAHNQGVRNILNSSNAIKYELFQEKLEKLGSITVECCRLLIDLNLGYIEAHFTEGINIDRLNGCDNGTAETQTSNQQILPLYAFSPQEYITQIGQHLLTLRKQTEQFDHIDSRPLKLALEYLQQAQNVQIDVRSCVSVTDIILKCISRHCIRSLEGRTSNSILSRLTPNGRRQLATDAMYLDNVLEDLGLLTANEPHVEKFKSLFAQ